MKLKLIIAAAVLTALASCQKGETKIEVNLTDIPEGYVVEMGRSDDRDSYTIYCDSSKTTDRKFTIKCDSLTDTLCTILLYRKTATSTVLPQFKFLWRMVALQLLQVLDYSRACGLSTANIRVRFLETR